MTRRAWLCGAAGLAACGGPPPRPKASAPARRYRILLRGEWGSLGDRARTLGLLRLIRLQVPEADTTVWLDAADARIPGVPVVPRPGPADLLLCQGTPGGEELALWRTAGGGRYGILGARLTKPPNARLAETLRGAAFVFATDSASAAFARRAVVEAAFAPDAGFSLKAADEDAARRVLERNGLAPKRFVAILCGPAAGAERCGKLRQAISGWTARTGGKVLAGGGAGWDVGEASSILRRALVVASVDPGEAVMAAAADTPALLLASPAAPAARMWKDIGMGSWVVDLDRTDAAQVALGILAFIRDDYAAAQVDVHEAVIFARKLQSDAMRRLRATLLAEPSGIPRTNAKKC